MRCIAVNVKLLEYLETDRTIKQESEVNTEEHFDPNLQLEQSSASTVESVVIEKCGSTGRSQRNLKNVRIPVNESVKHSSTRKTSSSTRSMSSLVENPCEPSTTPFKSKNLCPDGQTGIPFLVTVKVEPSEMEESQSDPLDLISCSYANGLNESKPEILNMFDGESLINNYILKNEEDIGSFDMFIKPKSVVPVESSSTSRASIDRNMKQNCNNCGKTITSRKLPHCDFCAKCLKERNEKIVKTFECDLCSKVFKSEPALFKHLRCHPRLNRFRCSVCGRRCGSGKILTTHLKAKHSANANMTCGLCKSTKRHKSLTALLTHMNKKHDMGASVASSTDDDDDTKHSFDDTAEVVDVESREKIRLRPKGERVRKVKEASLCSYCGKTFGTSAHLSQHVRYTHLGIKKFNCSLCDKCYKSPSRLRNHVDSIHEKKKFQCSLCGSILSSSDSLYSHTRKHALRRKEPALKCPLCPKLFRTKKYVERHVRSHTGETPYKCSHCPREFTLEWNRLQHERLHTGEKRYKCEVCGKAFTHNVSRKNHMKYHKEEDDVTLQETGLECVHLGT